MIAARRSLAFLGEFSCGTFAKPECARVGVPPCVACAVLRPCSPPRRGLSDCPRAPSLKSSCVHVPMDSEDGSFLRSLREPTSDKSIGRGSDQDIALPPRLATVSRRFWVYLGLLFHNPVEERVFLRTLSSSRIKSGLTICFFLLARQFILMMHMTPAGVDAGCRSQAVASSSYKSCG